MKDETIKVLWIATLIVVLECAAMFKGFNGTSLALAIGGLCGLGGYELRGLMQTRREEEKKK